VPAGAAWSCLDYTPADALKSFAFRLDCPTVSFSICHHALTHCICPDDLDICETYLLPSAGKHINALQRPASKLPMQLEQIGTLRLGLTQMTSHVTSKPSHL
jgi:hypothetical protein